MSRLIKIATTTIIPGNPGVPATSGSPYIPAYTTYASGFYVATFYDINNKVISTISGDAAYIQMWVNIIGEKAIKVDIVDKPVAVIHPEVAAIPGSPGVAPTPTQIRQSLNSGWNSWARSVDTIPAGEFIQYSVPFGVNGVFLGLGRIGKEGHNVQTFSHGLMIDVSGVWVFESGVKVKLVTANYASDTLLRIVRQEDNTIVYLVISGTSTLHWLSSATVPPLPLYGYGCLYSAGDTINDADLVAGSVKFGRV